MSDTSHKFEYWNMIRKGISQSEVARQVEITRQAVNKATKSFERDLLDSLLKFAQSLGILVEWYSVSQGVLVGIAPQLDNLLVMLIVDNHGNMKVYYNQDERSDGQEEKEKILALIRDALDIDLPTTATFKQIVNRIRGGQKYEEYIR